MATNQSPAIRIPHSVTASVSGDHASHRPAELTTYLQLRPAVLQELYGWKTLLEQYHEQEKLINTRKQQVASLDPLWQPMQSQQGRRDLSDLKFRVLAMAKTLNETLPVYLEAASAAIAACDAIKKQPVFPKLHASASTPNSTGDETGRANFQIDAELQRFARDRALIERYLAQARLFHNRQIVDPSLLPLEKAEIETSSRLSPNKEGKKYSLSALRNAVATKRGAR